MKGKIQSAAKASVLFTLLSLVSFSTSAQWTQLGQDIDGELAGDQSGFWIEMNATGNRVGIGAPKNNGNGSNSGHVRVYERTGTSWTQLGADIDGETTFDQSGTALSINAAGDRVAIGSRLNSGNGSNAGHVRVFQWNGTIWSQLGQDIDGGTAGDESGSSISLNDLGNRVAIGAEGNDGNGINSGHVRVYEWNGIAWSQLGADIDGDSLNDNSGFSVSFNSLGNRLAIGAPLNDRNGRDAGQVRIFEWSGTSWAQLGTDIYGEAVGDRSGYAVSMNSAGSQLVIGAPFNNGNGGSSGHARVYNWNGTSWIQKGMDIDGEAFDDNSGISVNMNDSEDRIVVGAQLNNGNGFRSGHVRLYEWSGTAWFQIGIDLDGEAANDWSGNSVSINAVGDQVAVGAWLNNGNGNDAGHVRAYQNILATNVDEVENEDQVSIYPNPARENLILETQNSIGEVVQITSITGALILEFIITKEKEKIDVSGFQNGIYFLRVGERAQKIVVSR